MLDHTGLQAASLLTWVDGEMSSIGSLVNAIGLPGDYFCP